MAIPPNPLFIPAFSIEDVLLDKDTGAPLSGGLVYFEQDNQRGTLKPVFQITGTSPNYTFTQLPNPMTLSSIGTFVDSLDNPTIPYFYPYDANGDPELYYIRVTSSEDVPQFTRQAQPYIAASGDVTASSAFENEISNPQFAEVLFDTSTSTYVYNFNAASQEVVNIAPDWDIIVSSAGVGTVTVSQITPVGTLNIATNPGTILSIESAGLSRLRLRQRLYGSPNLWGSGYLAASFVAKTYSGSDVTLTLYYSQSNGSVTDEAIVTATLLSSGLYSAHPGSVLIPASTSTQFYPDAYVDIEFDIPLSVKIDITSVMLAMTGATSVNDIVYDQQSQNRQIDHLFHYYKPQLEFKPIPSLLTAWDFPLNPAQENGTGVTLTTTGKYIWDQTIGKSVVGNVTITRNSMTGGIQAVNTNASEAYYYLQYLTGAQAKEILGNKLAVNIDAYRTTAGGDVTVNVYLYRGSSAASFPSLPTTIGTIAASGVFTLTAANWTLIDRGNLGLASATLPILTVNSDLNTLEDLKFNGWQVTDTTQIGDTDKFAIVVTFKTATVNTVTVTNSIALVKGDIPTRPAPQTPDEVLRECQYYFEKSKSNGIPITDNDATNSVMKMMATETSGAVVSLYSRSFDIIYQVPKVKLPSFGLWAIDGTSNQVTGYTWDAGTQVGSGALSAIGGGALWGTQNAGLKSIQLVSQTNSAYLVVAHAAGYGVEAFILFHYQADSRLGI